MTTPEECLLVVLIHLAQLQQLIKKRWKPKLILGGLNSKRFSILSNPPCEHLIWPFH
jgi:hypothetical protein